MDYKRTMLKVITGAMLIALALVLAVGYVQAAVTASTGFEGDGPTVTADFRKVQRSPDAGNSVYPDWKAEYWGNRRLEGAPLLVRNEKHICFDWKAGSPAHRVPNDRFSARWTREMTFRRGIYRFFAHADDGFRFYIDGVLLLDEWHDFTRNGDYSVELALDGVHDFRMEYYEREGVARAYLSWIKIDANPYNDGPYCAGATINLTGGPDGMSSYSWTGPNGFISDEQSPSIPNATLDMSGVYELTIADQNGRTDSATTTVIVNPNPTAEASNDGPYCTGSTIHLIGGPDGMSSYSWTGPDGFSSDKQSPSRPNATRKMSGDYVLTVTDRNGCMGSATTPTEVTVYQSPTAEASNGGPYCAGDTIQLIGGPDGMRSYSWTGPDGFTSSEQSPSISDATTEMDGDYELTVTSEHNCTDQARTKVIVHPKPQADARNDGPCCAGETINLTGGPAGMSSYSWTGPNGFSSDERSPSISDAITDMTGEYTLTVTHQNGCTDSATTWVIVHPSPTADPRNDGPYCAGETINLIGRPDGMMSYSWTGPNGFSSDEQSPSIPGVLLAGSYVYVLTVTNEHNCTGSATTTVIVYPSPVAEASNDGPYCIGATINLTGGPDGMSSYSWTGPDGFSSDEQSPSIPNATLEKAGIYFLTVTDDKGCTDDDTTTVIVYDEIPATASNDGPYCVGETINLIGGPSGMSSYSWTGPDGFSSDEQFPSIPGVLPAGSYVYELTVTDEHGCTGSATTTVIVNPNPTAEASNDGPYCPGDTINLIGGPSGMSSYSWTGPNGFTSDEQSPSIPNATLEMAGDYQLAVTDQNGCMDSATTTVTVYPRPTAEASNGGPYCAGDTIQLIGGPDGMSSYSWTGPNGFSSDEQSPSIPDATTAMAGDYILTVTDGNGCTGSATTPVIVNPNPTAEAWNDGPYVVGDTINLFGGPDGMSSYSWTGPNGFTSDEQSPSIPNATPVMTGDYVLTVTDQNGCTDSATTRVLFIVRFREGEDGYAGTTDTFINVWDREAKYGDWGDFRVREGDIKKGLIRFDLTGVFDLTSVDVAEAGITFYVLGRTNPNPMWLEAYQVLSPWEEMEATWIEASTGVPWGAPGCDEPDVDFDPNAVGRTEMDCERCVVEIEVTDAVINWGQYPGTNFGILLRGEGDVAVRYNFATSGYSVDEWHPELYITYSVSSAP